MAETKKGGKVRTELISMGLLAAIKRLQQVKKVPVSKVAYNAG